MDLIEKLLSQNKTWVEDKNREDHEFFHRLAKEQTPHFLWIGCSDSRVPASVITASTPGEMFELRNVANMVVHTDMSMLSVLDYAVNALKVEHVIVCGHYGCGGVRAAMSSNQLGFIDNWIRHIKDVYRLHQDELEAIEDPQKRENRFVELNVIEQVHDLTKTSIIQDAWTARKRPYIHGWVYDINNGIIRDLGVTIKDNSDIKDKYKYKYRAIIDPR